MPLALLSVSDKQGLESFAAGLVAEGFKLVSTGDTCKALNKAGIPARQVADLTGFPEILGGRVKTLHPNVHGGILAKRTEAHLRELQAHGIAPFDLVAVNLYPFAATVARGADEEEVLENIDIGGPTLLRAAAKNYPAVLPVCDPDDYPRVLAALKAGLEEGFRRELARKAFAHTAAYDAAIVSWFDQGVTLPETLHLSLERVQPLRYGENPQQQGARYRETGSRGCWDEAVQRGGLPLSYLNLFDADAAWRLAHEFEAPAAVIVKHASPCGVALAESVETAYAQAFACDPKSAFGGVVAVNRPVSAALAEKIVRNPKADVLIAPAHAPEALARFAKKRKNMRVLEAPPPAEPGMELRRIDGGFLVQEPDRVRLESPSYQVVTHLKPTAAQWRDLEVADIACAYAKSNAIVLVKDGVAVGVGAGQQRRVDAGELAARKAAGRAKGGACASDAFYPFRDGVEAAAAAGVAAVIQPGGSIRDEEVIAAANELGLAMVFTGRRHFRH